MRTATERGNRRLLARLLVVTVFCFAFGFALVPLYDVFCEVTGLNGKTAGPGDFTVGGLGGTGDALANFIDTRRVITIEFTDTVMPGLPWEISPQTARLDVHPGELHLVTYLVRNLSNEPVVGQAVPSVSPGVAAASFNKIDCFCFTQQALAPGETKELPLLFTLKPDIDKGVHTITLAYAFFNTGGASPASRQGLP